MYTKIGLQATYHKRYTVEHLEVGKKLKTKTILKWIEFGIVKLAGSF